MCLHEEQRKRFEPRQQLKGHVSVKFVSDNERLRQQ